MPDGRNGKCKRPEARIILQVQRNGRETGKARTSARDGNAMAPGSKWFGHQQKHQYLMRQTKSNQSSLLISPRQWNNFHKGRVAKCQQNLLENDPECVFRNSRKLETHTEHHWNIWGGAWMVWVMRVQGLWEPSLLPHLIYLSLIRPGKVSTDDFWGNTNKFFFFFWFYFLRNVSDLITVEFNVPTCIFPKENAILLLF